MTLFYNSYVLSRIDYCLTVWGSLTQNNVQQLECLQKKCARIILNVGYDTPSSQLYSSLRWMNVNQRIMYMKCITVYKILHGMMPSHLQLLFTNLNETARLYSLRSASDQLLYVPKVNRDIMRRSLRYAGARM